MARWRQRGPRAGITPCPRRPAARLSRRHHHLSQQGGWSPASRATCAGQASCRRTLPQPARLEGRGKASRDSSAEALDWQLSRRGMDRQVLGSKRARQSQRLGRRGNPDQTFVRMYTFLSGTSAWNSGSSLS